MQRKLLISIVAAVVVIFMAALAFVLSLRKESPTPPSEMPKPAIQAAPATIPEGEAATRRHMTAGLKAGDVDPSIGRKILYYHDPMMPGNKFDRPGKSPFMEMMLVPVYAGGDADAGTVSVSPRVQQSLGVRTAEVTRGTLSPRLTAVGNIAYDERDQAIVQARTTGFVERLHVRALLDQVVKGQPVLELYVPEWIAAQEEFLSVRRMQGDGLDAVLNGARHRMRQSGMSEEQIATVERTGRVQARTTLRAPISGVVSELTAREGATVSTGQSLFRLNGTTTVWAHAEIPESQAALIKLGARVEAMSPALPEDVFDGKVQAIVPEVNLATRTLKVRMALANPKGRLVPGMSVSMRFVEATTEETLLVPSEALIVTGRRTLIMLAEEGGKFRSVEVETGRESDGRTQIKRGLEAGQRVVVSSQFLIDSEANLKGAQPRFEDAPISAQGDAREKK